MKEFKTPDKTREPVEFMIDDEKFVFTPPKRAGLVLSVLTSGGLNRSITDADSLRDLLNWFSDGLGEEQNQKIMDRLADEEDEFDLPEVTQIARWLASETSGRPTKRR